MKKKRKILSAGPIALLSASALLLAGSTVGSTRAALTYYSDNYTADMSVSSIGVSLTENGKTISSRDYSHGNNEWDVTKGELFKDLQKDDSIVPGKAYGEELGVTNSGSIDSYVRVILTKSWTDTKGNKDTELSPDFIDLHFVEGNGWIIDETASTPERTILYYTGIVPAGESTPNFTDTLKIDNKIAEKVKVETDKDEEGNEIIRHIYKYDGYQFHVDAEVNAVQTHNAQDAIKSAWGVDVNVSADGTLSLQ